MKETSRQDRRHSSSGSSPRPSDGSPASALTCLSRLSLTATLSGKSSVSDGAHKSILILRVSALPLVGGRWFLFGRSVGRSSLTAVQLLPVEDSEDISVTLITEGTGDTHSIDQSAAEDKHRDEKHRSTLFLLSICTDEQNGSDENSEKAVKLRESVHIKKVSVVACAFTASQWKLTVAKGTNFILLLEEDMKTSLLKLMDLVYRADEG
ncbi:hypothetical protein MJT46_015431 [Ovis ammon polii x Ovis aries]|nr:hypothetical protein MJT46_015431 [Ovis ammon polii x Ovis aries]